MRKTIVVEGVVDKGIVLAPGALRMPESSIPIKVGDRQIGWAQDMLRDEATGEVSLELQLYNQTHNDLLEYLVVADYHRLEPAQDVGKPPYKVATASLSHIAAWPNSGFPRGVFKSKPNDDG